MCQLAVIGHGVTWRALHHLRRLVDLGGLIGSYHRLRYLRLGRGGDHLRGLDGRHRRRLFLGRGWQRVDAVARNCDARGGTSNATIKTGAIARDTVVRLAM